jgi:hypothetical protein
MSQLYHEGECGGAVISGFRLVMRVLTWTFQEKTLIPGAAEARPLSESGELHSGEDYPITFFCSKCGKEFITEDDFKQIRAGCFVCGHQHKIEDMVSTAYTPLAGKECLEGWLKIPDQTIPPSCRKNAVLSILLNKKISI